MHAGIAAAANKEAAKAARRRGVLALQRDVKEGVAALRRSLELDPENPDGWHMLGYVLALLGDSTAAQAALAKSPTNTSAKTGVTNRTQAAAYAVRHRLSSVSRAVRGYDPAVGAGAGGPGD